MTILPKKKPTKEKNERENQDHSKNIPHSHSLGHNLALGHSTGIDNRLERAGRSRTSPPRWLGPTSSRDEKLATHDPGGSQFEFEAVESGSSHNVNKRSRHRSPPRRGTRKHRNPCSASASHSRSQVQDYEDSAQGYNSEDEYQAPAVPDNIEELEKWFSRSLREKKRLLIKKTVEDGACLFRAVADQVYGDQEMHDVVRKHCVDYMAKNADYFMHYVTEDFTTYLNRKRHMNCHGNHIEIQSLSELFNRAIEVYQYSLEPINTFHGSVRTDNEPIRISYHRNSHYNSIVDPYKATIGVGLGLPGFQPGLADKTLMQNAKQQSENVQIEQNMLEDKMKETDWEVTQESIEEQVARESYLQWLRDNEKRAQGQSSTKSASATCSSLAEYKQCNPIDLGQCCGSPDNRRPKGRCSPSSKQNSPQHPGVSTEVLPHLPEVMQTSEPSISTEQEIAGATAEDPMQTQETQSLMTDNLPPSLYGLGDYDEEDILARVMAQSQLEYLNSLKKTVASTSTTTTPNTDSLSTLQELPPNS